MYSGKWWAMRSAADRWDTTIRFCLICVVLQVPLLVWLITKH